MSCRRFRAKPVEAVAQVLPAATPRISDSMAMTTSWMPYWTMTSMPQPACISLMRLAITNGIMHSKMTSPTTRIGVKIAGFLNSRMLLLSVLMIPVIPENSSYPNSGSLPPPWAAAPRRIHTSCGAAPSGVYQTNSMKINENRGIGNRAL